MTLSRTDVQDVLRSVWAKIKGRRTFREENPRLVALVFAALNEDDETIEQARRRRLCTEEKEHIMLGTRRMLRRLEKEGYHFTHNAAGRLIEGITSLVEEQVALIVTDWELVQKGEHSE